MQTLDPPVINQPTSNKKYIYNNTVQTTPTSSPISNLRALRIPTRVEYTVVFSENSLALKPPPHYLM